MPIQRAASGPSCCRATIGAKLRIDPALGRLVAELEAQLLVKAIDPLRIDIPALASEQHMDPAIAITHARLGDLLGASHALDGEIFALAAPDPAASLRDREVDLMPLIGVPVFVSRGGYYRTLGPRYAVEAAARLSFLHEVSTEERDLALTHLRDRGAYYVVVDGGGPQWAESAPDADFRAPGVVIFKTAPVR
jgi:hypothetical protein